MRNWNSARSPLFVLALCAATLFFIGCDDGAGNTENPDGAADSTIGQPDGTTAPDGTAQPDLVPDATSSPDMSAPDATPDAAPDAAPDSSAPDLVADAPSDAPADIPQGPCGDGVVDGTAGELCDPGIQAGLPGACRTDCPTLDACQPVNVTGSPMTCDVQCVDGTPISACADGDGCCPMGCDGMDTDCAPPTVFRPDSLEIRDPHMYLDFLGCMDSTDTLNTLFIQSLTQDGSGDGFLDLSLLFKFMPYDTAATTPRNFQISGGACTDPIATTVCGENPTFMPVDTTYLNGPAAMQSTCLEPIPNTLSGYSPAPNVPAAPCFSTTELSFALDFQGVRIPLEHARLSGTYTSPTRIENGVIVGFLDEMTAGTLLLPDTLPLVGGMALGSLLAGGGSCEDGNSDDRDVGPDGITPGWWFYIDFTADEITYQP